MAEIRVTQQFIEVLQSPNPPVATGSPWWFRFFVLCRRGR
jgi:hypothetical protein